MDALMIKAESYMQRGEYQQARKIYNDILARDPNNAKAYNKLGVILAREGNVEQARVHFINALKLNPRLSSAASNLGNIYFEARDLEKAKEYYEKAIALDPENPIPYNNLAVIYKQSKDIDKYVKFYKKSVELSARRISSSGIPQQKKGAMRPVYKAVTGFLAIALVIYLLTSFVR
ncbi:MAG TPA: tetratricopeptide repeat protein [Thermoanaerobacterales bacterium]|nr:tetratricopeptide repeat protein [Thermoanaerobacterales bacterium]